MDRQNNTRHKFELGLFAASVSQLTVPETIQLLAQQEYRWIEWRLQTRNAIETSPWGKAYNTLAVEEIDSDANTMKILLDDHGIRVSAFQVDIQDADQAMVKTVLAAAQQLGCQNVLLAAPGYDPSIGYRTQRDTFREKLDRWVLQVKGLNIRICVENHMWTIIPSISLVMDLLDGFSTDDVGVMWDPANGYWEGMEIPAMALDLVGDYLAEVHFKNGAWGRKEDGSWEYNWCDIETGMVNWSQTLDLISSSGYKGPLVVEDYRQIQPAEKLSKAKNSLNTLLAG